MTEIRPDFEITADSNTSNVAAPVVKRELTPEERLWEMDDSFDTIPAPVETPKLHIDTEEKKVEMPEEEDSDDIYIEPAETEEEASKVIEIDEDIPVFNGSEPLRTLEEQVEVAEPVVEKNDADDIFVEDTSVAVEEEAVESVELKLDTDAAVTDDAITVTEEEEAPLTIDAPELSVFEESEEVEESVPVVEAEEPAVAAAASLLTGGDTLLAQIDAFREKAMQLATMINEKENKAKELESVVASYEEKNRLLEEELNAKQEEADALKTDVESQVNRMLAGLKEDMNKMGVDISDRVSACSMNINTDDITASISDYFDSVTKAVNGAKDELIEKYHSENVRLYRNVQDLMKELDNSDEILLKSQQQYNSLKTRFGIVTGLLVLNFCIAVCVLILSLNLF